ncbi:MAG: histone deacetylase [Planctomycetes bacterium]|nr:histone deacetylase [Planctomycetota bacterium]MBI3835947.1 histone deacetylase [Planctomycetota bacterium]
MSRTGLILDERFERHVTAPGHPERPERLVAIAQSLEKSGLADQCVRIAPKPIEATDLRRVHDQDYLTRLEEACLRGDSYIDVPDSNICRESFEIARLAAGSVIVAIDEVLNGQIKNAFCAVRPPGHHAERHMSLGFCLLNNIALGAAHLLEAKKLERVLILDWDVHHGNGTQHTFESDPRVMFISIHGHPGLLYPGTGYAEERGRGNGEGYTINVPVLPPGRDVTYRAAFEEVIMPAIENYRPQFMLISAGFDAHALDPLAPLELETESFGWMTDAMTSAARRHCEGRLVSVLEGGYHLEALADSVALHLDRLIEAP